MNDQIQKLASQSSLISNYIIGLDPNNTRILAKPEDVEDFANRIIQVCVTAIAESVDRYEHNDSEWERGYNKGLRHAIAIITNHFGVE